MKKVIARRHFEDPNGLIVDVLLAEDTADQARLHYATAVIGYNQAQINLLAALGLIDPTNMVGRSTATPVLRAVTEPSGSTPK